MSGDIKVDDMVMITRGAPCCGATAARAGIPWIVARSETVERGWCYRCGAVFENITVFYESPNGHVEGKSHAPRSMLTKIDPPAEEIEAPAPPVAMPDRVIA